MAEPDGVHDRRKPRIAFMLAKDLSHAVTTMDWDLKWERVATASGQPVFLSPAGERIQIIDKDSLDRLHGQERGATLYLGYGYEEVHDWEWMHSHLQIAMGFILVDVSAPLARYRMMEAQRHGV